MAGTPVSTVGDIAAFLEAFAPHRLAAPWDNVGLLVGDRARQVERLITCLTLTPAVAAEAVRERAKVVVVHHPLPFRPIQRITADDPTGRILLDLIHAGVAIYSPHTAFDSAAAGINQQLAEALQLCDISPLEPLSNDNMLGAGRFGSLSHPRPLMVLAEALKRFLKIGGLHLVGDPQRPVEHVAVACGSAGEFLDVAIRQNCEVLITGEARLHTCYEAEARGSALILTGHYASERFGVETLAAVLGEAFPRVQVWASRDERDPLVWR